MGLELGIYESHVLQSNTMLQWLLDSSSDNFRYLILMQRDWFGYCSDWTCERFSFCLQWDFNWKPLDLKYCTLPLCHIDFRFLPMTISGIYHWWRGIAGANVLIGLLREFHLPHNGIWTWDLWISCPAVKHYATVTSGFHFWQFQYLNLVQQDWW